MHPDVRAVTDARTINGIAIDRFGFVDIWPRMMAQGV
jgi:hypothetical protein